MLVTIHHEGTKSVIPIRPTNPVHPTNPYSTTAFLSRGSPTRTPASIDFPVCRSARSWRSTEINASSAEPISSALVAQSSFQMSAGLDARRVVSCRPRPLSLEAFVACGFADDVHQRADGELREVADEGEQAIVFFW